MVRASCIFTADIEGLGFISTLLNQHLSVSNNTQIKKAILN